MDAQTTASQSRAGYSDGLLRYRVAVANLQILTGNFKHVEDLCTADARVCACSSACSGSAKQDGEKGGDTAAEAATPVQVEAAKREPIQHVITAEAILYPINQANVMPKISAPVQAFSGQPWGPRQQGSGSCNVTRIGTSRQPPGKCGHLRTSAGGLQDNHGRNPAGRPDQGPTDVQSAQQALDAAKKLYENRQELFQQGALAQKLVDDAKVALVQAQSQYETAQRHLQSLQTVGRNEQVPGAQAQVDAAKAHLEMLRRKLLMPKSAVPSAASCRTGR